MLGAGFRNIREVRRPIGPANVAGNGEGNGEGPKHLGEMGAALGGSGRSAGVGWPGLKAAGLTVPPDNVEMVVGVGCVS